MKTPQEIVLENEIHTRIVNLIEQALKDLQAEDRDPEDGVWKELSQTAEAQASIILTDCKEYYS